MRMPHVALMAHITGEGRRVSEFAELMQVTRSAASQLVTILEQHGLVERVPDPRDGRAALVRATPAADLGFRVARHRYAEIEDEWQQILGARRLQGLWKSLVDLEQWQARRALTASRSGADPGLRTTKRRERVSTHSRERSGESRRSRSR